MQIEPAEDMANWEKFFKMRILLHAKKIFEKKKKLISLYSLWSSWWKLKNEGMKNFLKKKKRFSNFNSYWTWGNQE